MLRSLTPEERRKFRKQVKALRPGHKPCQITYILEYRCKVDDSNPGQLILPEPVKIVKIQIRRDFHCAPSPRQYKKGEIITVDESVAKRHVHNNNARIIND